MHLKYCQKKYEGMEYLQSIGNLIRARKKLYAVLSNPPAIVVQDLRELVPYPAK